ncbi:APOBEC1 complementation factor-like isoform X2 [Rhodnius prolixus]|uniref:APOBEC1 complementation factor-like isoform X2 n=1 Tax=Rhodnius prolixus TaxID=13249 RepID=UPI003D18D39E
MHCSLNEMDYEAKIIQVNGQRIFGGPPVGWVGEAPSRGTEVFISGLPRNIKENAFVPLFAKIGTIYCSRLMVDFSGNNRGFAFVQYSTVAEAKLAIKKLDGYEIQPQKKLHVTKSVDNCRLFVGHLPKTLSREQVENVLRLYTDDIKQIFIYYSLSDKTQNRGFCFVEYENHRAACLARRRFFTTGIPEWPDIVIDWAIPEEDVDEEVMKSVTVMYLRNLMLKTSEATLREILLKYVKSCEILRIRKVRDFAFVHFSNRDAATKCITTLNGIRLDGAEIFATWAKPAYALEKVGKSSKKDKKVSIEFNQNDLSATNNSFLNSDHESYMQPYFSSTPLKPSPKTTFSFNSRTDSYNELTGPSSYLSGSHSSPNRGKKLTKKYDNSLHHPRHDTLNIPKVMVLYFSIFSPATALQKLYNHFGWGTVEFKVWLCPSRDRAFQQYFATIHIHHGEGGATSYYNLCHTPFNTQDDAKNAAAQAFVRSYLGNQFSE